MLRLAIILAVAVVISFQQEVSEGKLQRGGAESIGVRGF